MSIGERIKNKRKQSKLTQIELGRLVNVSSQVISNWERGYSEPNHDDVARLSVALDCSTEYLHGVNKNRTSNKDTSLPHLTQKEEQDIARKLEAILGDLDSESSLAFDGEPLDDVTRELVREQIESNLRLAKQLAKRKFTPNKYRD